MPKGKKKASKQKVDTRFLDMQLQEMGYKKVKIGSGGGTIYLPKSKPKRKTAPKVIRRD